MGKKEESSLGDTATAPGGSPQPKRDVGTKGGGLQIPEVGQIWRLEIWRLELDDL